MPENTKGQRFTDEDLRVFLTLSSGDFANRLNSFTTDEIVRLRSLSDGPSAGEPTVTEQPDPAAEVKPATNGETPSKAPEPKKRSALDILNMVADIGIRSQGLSLGGRTSIGPVLRIIGSVKKDSGLLGLVGRSSLELREGGESALNILDNLISTSKVKPPIDRRDDRVDYKTGKPYSATADDLLEISRDTKINNLAGDRSRGEISSWVREDPRSEQADEYLQLVSEKWREEYKKNNELMEGRLGSITSALSLVAGAISKPGSLEDQRVSMFITDAISLQFTSWDKTFFGKPRESPYFLLDMAIDVALPATWLARALKIKKVVSISEASKAMLKEGIPLHVQAGALSKNIETIREARILAQKRGLDDIVERMTKHSDALEIERNRLDDAIKGGKDISKPTKPTEVELADARSKQLANNEKQVFGEKLDDVHDPLKTKETKFDPTGSFRKVIAKFDDRKLLAQRESLIRDTRSANRRIKSNKKLNRVNPDHLDDAELLEYEARKAAIKSDKASLRVYKGRMELYDNEMFRRSLTPTSPGKIKPAQKALLKPGEKFRHARKSLKEGQIRGLIGGGAVGGAISGFIGSEDEGLFNLGDIGPGLGVGILLGRFLGKRSVRQTLRRAAELLDDTAAAKRAAAEVLKRAPGATPEKIALTVKLASAAGGAGAANYLMNEGEGLPFWTVTGYTLMGALGGWAGGNVLVDKAARSRLLNMISLPETKVGQKKIFGQQLDPRSAVEAHESTLGDMSGAFPGKWFDAWVPDKWYTHSTIQRMGRATGTIGGGTAGFLAGGVQGVGSGDDFDFGSAAITGFMAAIIGTAVHSGIKYDKNFAAGINPNRFLREWLSRSGGLTPEFVLNRSILAKEMSGTMHRINDASTTVMRAVNKDQKIGDLLDELARGKKIDPNDFSPYVLQE